MQSTETSQFTTDATQAPTAAVSPFGPVRKREQPPVKIPGQRKASDTLPPRPTPPTQQLTARPLDWPTDADVDHALGNYGPGHYSTGGSAA